MTSFLYKVEAVHPKGEQHPGSMTKLKRALTTRPGKSLASKLKFLVTSVPDITQDRSFPSSEANKLFFTFKSLKPTSLHSLEEKLGIASNIISQAPKVYSELEDLFKSGYLHHVQKKDMEDFKSTLNDVVSVATEIEQLLTDLRRVKSETHKFGFNE